MNREGRAPQAFPILPFSAFALAAIAAAAIAIGHPYFALLLSPRTWQRLHLAEFPAKGALVLVLAVAATALAVHLARRAQDTRTLLVVLMAVGMQTTALKVVGINLITVLPFVAILFVIAESLLRPSTPLPVTSVVFFGLLLLLLDLPYLSNQNVYGPARFVINFLSALKAIVVAIAMVLVIEREDHLKAAVKAFVIVGIAAAVIGVIQILLHRYAGFTFSLVDEKHRMKLTFLGPMLRASGLTTWSQHLADFLVVVLPFMLFQLARAAPGRRRLAWLAGVAVVLAAVVLTFSYAAYFAVGVMLAIFPFMLTPRHSLHFLLAIVAFATVAYAAGGLEWAQDKYVRHIASSTGMVERRVYLQATFDEIARDPWLGSGFYAEEEFSGNFYRKRVHNTMLQAWTDLGLAGFLAFVAMIVVTFTQLCMSAARAREARWREMFQALALGMAGAIVSMLAEPNLTAPHTWFFLGLAAAAMRVWGRPAQPAAPA